MKEKIEKIYKNRKEFIIIGLTGKTGSGCSTVAKILENGYMEYNQIDCTQKEIQNRKAEIIKKFASKNFIEDDKKFKVIKPSTILIMIYLLDDKNRSKNKVISFKDIPLLNKLQEAIDNPNENSSEKEIYKDFVKKIKEIKTEYEKVKKSDFNIFLSKYSKTNSREFINLYIEFNSIIQKLREEKKLSTQNLQLIGDMVREYMDIYQLPTYCNFLIKAYRQEAKDNNESCYIVIDSLKNPFEIIYFKERYSAYYTFSIHSKDDTIKQRLKDLKFSLEDIKIIHNKEQNIDEKDKQKGSLDSSKDFNSQNITECIQRSDIYIDNNQDKKDTLYRQIFKYLSLIVHPGLINPSKDELIMQIALNAKLNSGCISRQVGAVVLNKHGTVKSVGWNEVPEGQMPCLLRSHNELLNNSRLTIYSKYEKDKFKKEDKFKYIFNEDKNINQYEVSDKLGLNDSFCFKSIQNDIDKNKNQVYTRSLHAEENAFLQASKYGNSEIIGGQLFTTASPCFLCAKKAYQLGIKRVVYIEAYPDISNEQVFDIGLHDIEVVHFRGATGLAYQKLYEPIFSYKDELKALNGVR